MADITSIMVLPFDDSALLGSKTKWQTAMNIKLVTLYIDPSQFEDHKHAFYHVKS